MIRDIITIDEDKCDGCSLCIPGCPEGAIQVIDGKARLVSDLSCDGLGACLGHCPQEAITIEKREAEPYDEITVIKEIIKGGSNVILAHLKHLRDHGETEYLKLAEDYLNDNNIENPLVDEDESDCSGGCPGSKAIDLTKSNNSVVSDTGKRVSELAQWPIQLHLLSPRAPYFKNADVLLAADCTAYSIGGFHRDFLKGKILAIACPKLDSGMDSYLEKLTSIVKDSEINTLTVLIMEVPCCGGLLGLANQAVMNAGRKIPIKKIVIGVKGDQLSEEWI